VKQITWWHQFQRKTDNEGRLITEKEDVQLAIDLLFETIILKVDELDGSLRQFFEQLKGFVLKQEEGEKYRFGRREIRQALKLSKAQQHRFLQQLLDLEYIKQMGGYANKGFVYQIEFWDDNQRLRREIQEFMNVQLNKL
jgi:Fic family protein